MGAIDSQESRLPFAFDTLGMCVCVCVCSAVLSVWLWWQGGAGGGDVVAGEALLLFFSLKVLLLCARAFSAKCVSACDAPPLYYSEDSLLVGVGGVGGTAPRPLLLGPAAAKSKKGGRRPGEKSDRPGMG